MIHLQQIIFQHYPAPVKGKGTPFLVIMLIICGGAIYTAGRSIYINNLPENNVNEIPSQVIFNHSNDTSNLNKNNFKKY